MRDRLLPTFLEHVAELTISTTTSNKDGNLTLVDLGCGTGRNTQALHHAAGPAARIVGLEPSRKMLDIARDRVGASNVSFELFDIPTTDITADTTSTSAPTELAAGPADGVISTLVLEHVPLRSFFRTAASLLRAGGVLLLTNMHPDMGSVSQAGFVHPTTRVKIRPTSYAHTVADVRAAAREAGFEVLGEIGEVGVTEEMVEKLGARAGKWIGMKVWFGGCLRKKIS